MNGFGKWENCGIGIYVVRYIIFFYDNIFQIIFLFKTLNYEI